MIEESINDVLFSEKVIAERIERLVEEMAKDNRCKKIVMIGILRGSFMFFADLVRALYHHGIHPIIEFTTMESYSGTESRGVVKVLKEFTTDITGADVIVVDDILDTGRTLDFAIKHLMERGAASVKTCVLLDKPERRILPLQADYVGFKIDDHFVIGYGLDYDGAYRELPYIARLTPKT